MPGFVSKQIASLIVLLSSEAEHFNVKMWTVELVGCVLYLLLFCFEQSS